jgi:hypothetical protein
MRLPRLVSASIVFVFLSQTAAPALAQYPATNEDREEKDTAELEEKQREQLEKIPQEGNATFRDYGLRVKTGFWKSKVLYGADARWFADVGSDGLGDLMALRSPEAAQFYASFKSRRTTARWISWGGISAMIASLFVEDDNSGAALGVFLGGFFVWVVGIAKTSSAADDLFNAIWEYNATLTDGAQSSQQYP